MRIAYRLTFCAAALCGLLSHAQAHNVWLKPSSTVLSKAEWITVDAAVSNDLFFFNHFPLNIEKLAVTAPDGGTVQPENVSRGKLRTVFDLGALGERTIQLDCDVLQADGGTRTAAITGAFVAAHDAVSWLMGQGKLTASPIRDFVAAVSVGVVQGTPLLDLEYVEDVACDTDMNIVMTGAGGFVEVQGTAEGAPFTRAELDSLLALADQGIRQLVAAQRQALGLA